MSRPPMCPNVRSPVPIAPIRNRMNPGTMNNQLGQNNSRNRRWRQPSRKLRKCGARERPSGRSVVGTSLMRSFARLAFTIISLANSMPARAETEVEDRVFSKRANAAVEVADRCSVEEAADARQERVADPAMEPRHRAGLDATREAVAHHEVVAVAEVLEERPEVLEVVAVVGIGHEHERAAHAARMPVINALP